MSLEFSIAKIWVNCITRKPVVMVTRGVVGVIQIDLATTKIMNKK